MDITLSTRHLERSAALLDLVHRRAAFALGRFADVVHRLEVRLTDSNGPRGGEDIDCLVLAHLAPTGRLVVAGRASSPESGVCRGLDRLAHTMRRHLDRLNHHRRGRR
jgi:hypothetical protein